MLPTIWFTAVALVHISLLAWSFRTDRDPSIRIWYLRLLLLTLTLDNIALTLGNAAVGTDWFDPMTRFRFVMHSLVLPLLTLFAWSLMKKAGVRFASHVAFKGFIWLFTLGALAYGFYHEVLTLELGPVQLFDIWRMTDLSGVPPMATIFTNLHIIILSAFIWKASGYKAMFLGALFAFMVNGALAGVEWFFLAGNFVEVVFILSLLHTARRLERYQA